MTRFPAAVAGLAFVAACLAAWLPTAVAQDEAEPAKVKLPFTPAVGQTVRFELVETKERQAGGQSQQALRSTTVFDLTPAAKTDEGYVFRLTYVDVRVDTPLPLPFLTDIAELSEGVTIEYRADPTGTPLSITNLPQVRETFAKALDLMDAGFTEWFQSLDLTDEQRAQLQQVFVDATGLFRQMTPEVANQAFLESARILFVATGGEYYVDYLSEYDTAYDFALAGTTITGIGAYEVARYEPEAGEAEVGWSFRPEPEALKAAVAAVIEALTAQTGEAAGAEARAQIEGLNSYQSEEVAKSVIDLADGMPKSVTYVKTVGTDDRRSIDTSQFTRVEP